jgi:hypothetical protein
MISIVTATTPIPQWLGICIIIGLIIILLIILGLVMRYRRKNQDI